MNAKQAVRITLIVCVTLLVLLLVWEFQRAVIIFAFSLAIAAAIRPFVETLSLRGLPRGAALVLAYLGLLLVLVGVIYLLGMLLAKEFQQLSDLVARQYDLIWRTWPNSNAPMEQAIASQLPPPEEFYAQFSPDRQSSAMQAILGVTVDSLGVLSDIAAMLILSLYWSIDQIHFERLWLSVLPVESRTHYRNIWRAIEKDFGKYVRSEILQSLLAALMLIVAFRLVGLPYPTLLAVFGALAWLIPWLGGILAVLPVALVGFGISTGMGIFAVALTMGILIFMEFYIEPRFIGRRQYSSLLNIVLILILAKPYGLLGIIVAPPLATAIELALRYRLQGRSAAVSSASVERIAELRTRVEGIHLLAQAEEVDLQTRSILERLEALVRRADQIINR